MPTQPVKKSSTPGRQGPTRYMFSELDKLSNEHIAVLSYKQKKNEFVLYMH